MPQESRAIDTYATSNPGGLLARPSLNLDRRFLRKGKEKRKRKERKRKERKRKERKRKERKRKERKRKEVNGRKEKERQCKMAAEGSQSQERIHMIPLEPQKKIMSMFEFDPI
jgi:hypothetical protein